MGLTRNPLVIYLYCIFRFLLYGRNENKYTALGNSKSEEKALQIARRRFPCATEATLLSRYEWGFSNKMLDLTRHIDKVRKA